MIILDDADEKVDEQLDEIRNDEMVEIDEIDIGEEIDELEVVDLVCTQQVETVENDDVGIIEVIEVKRDDTIVDEMVEMVEIDIFDDVDEPKLMPRLNEVLEVIERVDVLGV